VTFEARQHHAACKKFDDSIWIFGGLKNVGGRDVFMNDVMKLSN